MQKNSYRVAIFLVIAILIFTATGCQELATILDEPDTTAVIAPTDVPVITDAPVAPTDAVVPTDPVTRDYRTQIKGGGEDIVTLMIYLCGSDLESEGGAATNDLVEILEADISEKVNVVIETGGANAWMNDMMDPTINQRWLATYDNLQLLEDTESKNMSDGSTLQDFISFSAENFPADRYMLVLWDHGGGTVDGYAYDERYADNTMMTLAELDGALAGAGVAFDMIGFDCCLMGTAETAFTTEKYADYMVASQRVEPGYGWHYTPWISALSENTSMPTEKLGEVIVDSFIEHNIDGYYGNELTLATVDLTYIPDLFDTMSTYFSEAQSSMVGDGMFVATTQMLGESRAMQSDYDLVDMDYLLSNMEDGEELRQKLQNCVVYNGATIENYNGLCLYFPYSNLEKVDSALEIYDQIGIDENYQSFIASFANLLLGGQVYNSGDTSSVNPYSGEGTDLSSLIDSEWVDENIWDSEESFYEETSYDSEGLAIDEKYDEVDDVYYVLSLTDEEWELITDVEQRVFLDNGDGFVDLGADSIYEFDEDGDLIIGFDNTWVSLDGQLVCFYTDVMISEDDYWYNYGLVPILYEDEYAELVIMWSDLVPEGYVAGWRYIEPSAGSQKGLYEIEDGMYFDFLCDFYTYDGEYDDQYLWGGMTVDGSITVSYEDVGDSDVEVYYELYDIYNNSYWTESVVYSWDNVADSLSPELLELSEQVTASASGITDIGLDMYYATTDELMILAFYDPEADEYAVVMGVATVEGNSVTITDSDGYSFTFTVEVSEDDYMVLDTGDLGVAELYSCHIMEVMQVLQIYVDTLG